MSESQQSLCQSCGACCAYDAGWPRFTLEDDAQIARLAGLPGALLDERQAGMRAVDNRCVALAGTVGTATRCTVYADRPIVCRDCMPGDDACAMARHRYGMSVPDPERPSP